MKKSLSAALLLLSLLSILTICATTFSSAADLSDIIPDSPKNITAVNCANGVSISWKPVAETAGYKIYREGSNSEKTQIADIRGCDASTYTDTTVSSGKNYIYFVTSYNACNESEFSEPDETVYLKQPTLSKVAVAYGGIELKWAKTGGAEKYTVYRKNGKNNEIIKEITDNSVCTYKDTSVTDGKKYTYTVIAEKGIYRSSFAYKTSDVYYTAPKLVSAVNGNGKITVTWNKTKTAEKYRIYRKVNNAAQWQGVKTVKADVTSFTDTDVKNATKYTYTVRAVKGDYKSGYNTTGISRYYVAVPQNLKATNSENKIVFAWSKVSGTQKYRVYRKGANDKSPVMLTDTTTTKYTDSSVKNNSVYTYYVKAFGKSGLSAAAAVKTTALKTPSAFKGVCSDSGIKLSWSKMSSATGYRLYRKDSANADWKCIYIAKNNSTVSYTDTKVSSGKTYYYTVRQVKGSILGSYSKNGISVRYVSAPVVTANHSPSGVVLNWTSTPQGTGYEVQRKVLGDDSWTKIATIKSNKTTKYTDKKPIYGKKNYYRIKVTGAPNAIYSKSAALYGINPQKKMVALTYDDGPYTPVTNKILDTLEKNGGRATFFVVGSRVSEYSDCIKREAKLGCEIGNHTYNHTSLTSVSPSKIVSEIENTNDKVAAITGVSPVIVRAPGGDVNSKVKANAGYPLINWSVDTLDWKYRNSSSVVSNIKSDVRDGSIVLMHDLYTSTGNASTEIIPWLVNNGYQLVTVSELMAVKGIDMKNGELYTKAY